LPDNLKALFRPVSMIENDLMYISEIFLYSKGFLNSRDLAKKIVALIKISQYQLSP
jgi:dynein heavy chain, axonemal